MARDGYLRGVLADGARPFRYRGRVRGLLGQPEDTSVTVSFALPPAPIGFAYARSQFSGELYLPDELLAAPAGGRNFAADQFLDLPAAPVDAGPPAGAGASGPRPALGATRADARHSWHH